MSEDPSGMSWQERLRRVGKQGFIRAEMERLGYWPPDESVAMAAAQAEAELRGLYKELSRMRAELDGIETQIREVGDIPKLIADIRRRRIERVRAERTRRKAECMQAREASRIQDKAWRETTLPHLGRGVSAGLNYAGGNVKRLRAAHLPVLEDAAQIAAAIGIPIKDLSWLTYHRPAAKTDHYNRFEIPKKRGGRRVISSPKKRLCVAQEWLLNAVLLPQAPHPAATAFRPGASIVDNAARHAGKAVVIRVDLKDFFPSIKVGRVKGLFEKMGYNEGVSTIFALIATESPRVKLMLDGETRHVAVGERQLPQGACTSPALTNLLCRRLDARLTGLASKNGFVYSRYADDLVFSCSEEKTPLGLFLKLVGRILEEENFVVNPEKTAVMRPCHRQAVTGLVVNETPRVSRAGMRRFRALLHQCRTQGAQVVSERLGRDVLAHAAGYLSFLHMVDPEQEARIQRDHPWLTRWKKEASR